MVRVGGTRISVDKRPIKAPKKSTNQRLALPDNFLQLRVHQGGEQNRPAAVFFSGRIYEIDGGLGFFRGIDEWQSTLSNSICSNCVSSVWPRVSAVIPVPSETKKTVLLMFGGSEAGRSETT